MKIDGQDHRLFDNSYLAKGGEDYGLKADKDLRNLHGDRFRHEKTKKKKGSYKGAAGTYEFDAQRDLKSSPVTVFNFKAGPPNAVTSY